MKLHAYGKRERNPIVEIFQYHFCYTDPQINV
jgi:hypothetical protein